MICKPCAYAGDYTHAAFENLEGSTDPSPRANLRRRNTVRRRARALHEKCRRPGCTCQHFVAPDEEAP